MIGDVVLKSRAQRGNRMATQNTGRYSELAASSVKQAIGEHF